MSISGASASLDLGPGLDLSISPLTDKDIVELDRWIQKRYVENAYEGLRDILPKEDLALALQNITLASLGVSWTSRAGLMILSTVEGMVQLVYQSAKSNHPNLDKSQLQSAMLKPENIDKANVAFVQANPSAQPKKKRRSPRQRKRVKK